MYCRLILCVAALLLFGQQCQCRAQGKKYALVVGVEKYNPSQLTSLQYAEDDADALGESLQRLGFDVIVMTRQSDIPERVPAFADDILTQLKRRVRGRSTDDTVLVALSGHGVQLKGDKASKDGTKETYFCPERADLRNKSTLLAMSDVIALLKQCNAGRKLLLVDACRNEVEPKDIAGKDSSPVEIELDPAGVTRRTIPGGMVALFSCGAKERSFEVSRLNHSVFTYHVLQYLNGKAAANRYPKQQISISELAAYVSRETRDYIDNRLGKDQNPELVLPDRRLIDWSLGGIPLPDVITNSIGMKLTLIPEGEFLMGSPLGEKWRPEIGLADEELQHRVRITKPFYMGVHEVTVGQFKRFVAATNYKTEAETDGQGGWGFEKSAGVTRDVKYNWRNNGISESDVHPAVNVSWNDAVAFCAWLSRAEGIEYRLPTEAEWEYACRAGTSTMYYHGNDPEGLVAVGNVADRSLLKEEPGLWNELKKLNNDSPGIVQPPLLTDDGFARAAPVGRFHPNNFGLYDMHGNVREWCGDTFNGDYSIIAIKKPWLAAPSFIKDPFCFESDAPFRVTRGGSYYSTRGECRSASRSMGSPSDVYGEQGFRLVRISEQ